VSVGDSLKAADINATIDAVNALAARVAILEAASSPGGGVLRVVDSVGQELGPLVSLQRAALFINNRWVNVTVSQSGWVTSSIGLHYESLDCSAEPLISVGAWVLPEARLTGQTLYVPSGSASEIVVQSRRSIGADGTPSTSGCTQEHQTIFATLVTQVDVATLGLIPPFEVVQ